MTSKPTDIERQLAEQLHTLCCTWDHTEHCDWLYGGWDERGLRWARQDYLDKARRIISACDENEIRTQDMAKCLGIVLKVMKP